ncbi:MAG: hypothetical protein ACP5GD_00255 [Candidatus Micrarchaeia archaeon]
MPSVAGSTEDAINNAASAEKTSVFLVGEAGGGLIWFDKDNWIGLYHILKERILAKNAPAAIIFHGEILPALPKYITKGGYSKSQPLQEDINSLDLAVVQVKPHLSRIAKLAKEEGIELYYVMGPSDRDNIAREHDMLVRIYTNSPKDLLQMIVSIREKIRANNKIIETTEKIMKKELEKTTQNTSKIQNMQEKIRQLKEENEDFEKLDQLYIKLVELWLEEHPGEAEQDKSLNPEEKGDISRLVNEIRGRGIEKSEIEKKIEELTRELEKTDKDKEPEKYKQLDEEIKKLNNELKKGTYKDIRKTKQKAEEGVFKRERPGELYTGHYAGSKELDALAFEIANAYIALNIRNAFGRRINIQILPELVNDIAIKGHAFRVSDLPSEASREYLSVQNYFKALVQGLTGTTIVTMAHTTSYHVDTVPPYNDVRKNTGVVYEVAVPPIIDGEKVKDAWRSGINTPLTKAVKKGKGVTTGFVEVTFDSNGVKTTYYSYEFLHQKAGEEYNIQREILNKLLRGNGNNITEKPSIEDKIQIHNKLPEEMNKRLIQLAKKYFPAALALPSHEQGETRRLDVLMVNDTHIGTAGYGEITTRRMLDALAKKLKEMGFSIGLLFLGGDNIEGAYKAIKYEKYEGRDIRGIYQLKGGALRIKYEAWLQEHQPIPSTNDQIAELVNNIKPLLRSAKTILLVSGQHTNKTYPDKTIDEATAIRDALLPIASKYGVREKDIIAVPGGDKGVGAVRLDDGTTIFVAHSLPNGLRFPNETVLALGADKHQHIVDVETDHGGHIIVKTTGASSSPITHFVNQIGISTSQSMRGFTTVSAEYGNRTHILHKLETYFISLDDLMPLIRKGLERDFGKEDLERLEKFEEGRITIKASS